MILKSARPMFIVTIFAVEYFMTVITKYEMFRALSFCHDTDRNHIKEFKK